METITLIGIIITFLTTIAGWFFTYRVQLNILKEQSDYQYHKEQQKILTEDNLVFLKDLQAWYEKGRKIYLGAMSISPLEMEKLESANTNDDERITILRKTIAQIKEAKHITSDFSELRAETPRLLYLAKIYDPLAINAPLWEWGNTNPPKDLPQLIDNFENEVLDQIYEMLYGESGRAYPNVHDQFHMLHEAGIRAIERIKSHIVFQEIEKGIKK